MRIGVLAIQGSFALHIRTLKQLGVEAVEVRKAAQLDGIDGIIIPGGESTTFERILESDDFGDKLRCRIKGGMPTWGTCAGAIMLGHGEGRPQPRWNLIDVAVERNAYGRQVDSFVTDLNIKGVTDSFPGVFIRAPRFPDHGNSIEVLASHDGEPVMLRDGNILISAFHPELTQDSSVHKWFVDEVCGKGKKRKAG